jgi:glycosyltransferase involved in cell wall biosynthesis
MKISCIIPAYNEEKNIGNILDLLTSIPNNYLFEIIVIDDGSSDRTEDIVKKYSNVTLIKNQNNLGKSKTITKGIENCNGDYVLMIDGDLVNLNKQNIIDLVNPIIQDEADISISYRGNTFKWWIKIFGIENLSGERCFSKTLVNNELEKIAKLKGFGLEVFINRLVVINNFRIKSVAMSNVIVDFNWKKFGLFKGVKMEIYKWGDILSVVNLKEFVVQIFKMRKLLVK